MSPLEILAACFVGAPAAIYVVVRFASAAFFKSKQQYDQRRKMTP